MGSWITVQTVISILIEIEGYDSPHEEATVQAGPATGQCERGGAAPGLAASNLDCDSLIGSDARGKGDAEQAA